MISIIVPVYNEGDNIKTLVKQITADIKTPHEIMVVYDFEEDNTIPVVKQINETSKLQIKCVKNIYGPGALNAIRSGFHLAERDAVLVMMADLSDDLRIVDTMYARIKVGYDVVCGSRYMKGGKQIGGPLIKRTLSRIAGVSLHYLTGIPTHDITNSFKMYSKKLLDSVSIESNGGFEIGMELTIKAYVRGFRVTEIPSTWTDRTAGESRFRMWKWIPKYLRWYSYGTVMSWTNKKTYHPQ